MASPNAWWRSCCPRSLYLRLIRQVSGASAIIRRRIPSTEVLHAGTSTIASLSLDVINAPPTSSTGQELAQCAAVNVGTASLSQVDRRTMCSVVYSHSIQLALLRTRQRRANLRLVLHEAERAPGTTLGQRGGRGTRRRSYGRRIGRYRSGPPSGDALDRRVCPCATLTAREEPGP